MKTPMKGEMTILFRFTIVVFKAIIDDSTPGGINLAIMMNTGIMVNALSIDSAKVPNKKYMGYSISP